MTATTVEGSHAPGFVWPAVVVVCEGWMLGRLEMGIWTRVWTRSCCVAASVVTARAGGRGRSACGGCGVLVLFGLGFGLGWGRFWCC